MRLEWMNCASNKIMRIVLKLSLLCLYGSFYAEHRKEERQSRLEFQYHITCKCKACQEDWLKISFTRNCPISPEDLLIYIMRNNNVETAKMAIPRTIRQVKSLEHLDPNAELLFYQKLLFHYYDILGNKRLVFWIFQVSISLKFNYVHFNNKNCVGVLHSYYVLTCAGQGATLPLGYYSGVDI